MWVWSAPGGVELTAVAAGGDETLAGTADGTVWEVEGEAKDSKCALRGRDPLTARCS